MSDGGIYKLVELVYDSFYRTFVTWLPYTASLQGSIVVA